MSRLPTFIKNWKLLHILCLLIVGSLVMIAIPQIRSISSQLRFELSKRQRLKKQPYVLDELNYTGALPFIEMYSKEFSGTGPLPNKAEVPIDPDKKETITTWWQAAALINWFIKTKHEYKCKERVKFGNKHVCQDEPYTVKAPCLVYSFGINFDFSFDDAMGRLGCEVHSFDPSMQIKGHLRNENVTFHDWGLAHLNTDVFEPRPDYYVREKQFWKARTLKRIMKELGHENRVIDILKIDIETYEWQVADNMLETGLFKYIRQFIVEYHIFRGAPPQEDFIHLFRIITDIHDEGFRQSALSCHQGPLTHSKFLLQGDSEYVNALFSKRNTRDNELDT